MAGEDVPCMKLKSVLIALIPSLNFGRCGDKSEVITCIYSRTGGEGVFLFVLCWRSVSLERTVFQEISQLQGIGGMIYGSAFSKAHQSKLNTFQYNS